MATFPRKCPKCRESRLNLVQGPYHTVLEHDNREYEIFLPDLSFLSCEACGNRIVPDDSEDRLFQELRRVAGLLNPEEIRERRKLLGLTQEQLADFLKVAKETISRWETGAQIQQRHTDLLLRICFDVPDVRRYLGMPCESTSGLPPGSGIPLPHSTREPVLSTAYPNE